MQNPKVMPVVWRSGGSTKNSDGTETNSTLHTMVMLDCPEIPQLDRLVLEVDPQKPNEFYIKKYDNDYVFEGDEFDLKAPLIDTTITINKNEE